MQVNVSDDRGPERLDPLYSLIRRQTGKGYAPGGGQRFEQRRPAQERNRREIEDVVSGIKWTEQDRWILQSWRRAVLDIKLRHLFVNGSDQDAPRGWCRMNPLDRAEIAALMVELIRSDRKVQDALLDWACRAPHRSSWD